MHRLLPSLANPRNRVRFQLKQPPGKAGISCTNPFRNPPAEARLWHGININVNYPGKRQPAEGGRQDATWTNRDLYERNHRAILHLWGLNWYHLPSPVPPVTINPFPVCYTATYKAPKIIWIIEKLREIFKKTIINWHRIVLIWKSKKWKEAEMHVRINLLAF